MLDSRRNIALACALSALAGYVDGIGFLHLGGLFVSFMSGNSTRLGVSLAEGRWHNAAEEVGLIALFVAGAAAGSLIVLGRGPHRQAWVLLAEATLLAIAALAYTLGQPELAVAAMVLAMGLENAVFQTQVGASLGLTYNHRRAGQGGPTRRRSAAGRAALELGAEPAVVGGAGGRGGMRHAVLPLDQSRRDLVCRGRGACLERGGFRDDAPAALTARDRR